MWKPIRFCFELVSKLLIDLKVVICYREEVGFFMSKLLLLNVFLLEFLEVFFIVVKNKWNARIQDFIKKKVTVY